MNDRSASVPLETLLSHAGWVRRLALQLTGDPDRADDLAQDAWKVALEHPPAPDARSPRAWLRTILSNLERRRRRDASLRAWHEARAVRSEAVSAEDDVEEQVVLQRRLADAILGLAEPHRSAIVLRYLQGLPLREVARRQDVSYDAARQRISRGLAMLRARLDREYGDRDSAWSALCATVCGHTHESARWLPWIPGGIAVALQTKVLTATAVILLCAFLVWRGARTDATSVPDPAASSSLQVLSASQPDDDAKEPPALSMERAPVPAASTARAVDRDRDFHGVVLDLSDKPIEGAQIAVYRNESDGYRDVERSEQRHRVGESTTDARGEFAIELPIGRPFEVEAGARGHARARLGFRYAGEHVTIHLGEGATLFGRVTRASDGASMPGAVLEVSTWASGPDWTRVHKGGTDAEGRFRVEELPPGLTSLRVTPPTEGAPFRSRIELSPGQIHEENVVIEEGLTIRGRVLDAVSKEPLSGAEVGETGWVTRWVRTDADGEYVYRGIRREGPVRVEARAPGHGRQGYLFRVGNNGSDDVPERRDFDLLPEHRLRGRVIDGDGKPIEDAFVAAVAARRLDSPANETDWIPGRTDKGGRFELAGLRADFAHSLVARKDGLGTVVYELPATESESATTDVGDVVLLPMAVVRGSVLDETGKAIPDQEVTLHGSNADRGRFRPERDPRDVSGLDYHAAQRTARTDDLGRFAIADVAAGEYRVETGLSRTTVKVSKVVKIATGERVDGVQLVLLALGRIAGIVTDPEGRGIVGAGISAEKKMESQASYASTDANGRFALEGLADGSYVIRISAGEFRLAGESDQRCLYLGQNVDGVRSGEKDVQIVLQPGEWLHGRVVDADGHGVVSASVTARAPGLDERRLDFSGTDGRFKVPVPKGIAVDLTARPPVITDGKVDGRRLDADPTHAGHLDNVVPSDAELVVKLPKLP